MPELTLQEIETQRAALAAAESVIRERERAAQAERDRAEREERYTRERAAEVLAIRAREALKDPYRIAVIDAMLCLQPHYQIKWENSTMVINGGYNEPNGNQITVEFNQRYLPGSRYKSDRNKLDGMFDIIVGCYGDKSRFPAKKDKTHSYDKIAAEIIHRHTKYIRAKRVEADRIRNEMTNKEDAQAIREEFKLQTYYGPVKCTPSKSEGGKVIIEVEVSKSYTPERAREVLKMLVEAGLLEVKE